MIAVETSEMRRGSPRQALHTVLVVDDDELIRRGITAVLGEHPQFSVCGSAGIECTAISLLERYQPDLLLLDLSLGHRDGLQFLKDISGRFANTLIVALSDEQRGTYRTRALEAGAAACLAKGASAAELIATVLSVMANKKQMEARRSSARGKVDPRPEAHDRSVAVLTDRELHVFRLIGAGLGTSRIAQELGLSRKTIETYRAHIKLKLGFSNAEALLKGALDWVHHAPAGSLDAHKK